MTGAVGQKYHKRRTRVKTTTNGRGKWNREQSNLKVRKLERGKKVGGKKSGRGGEGGGQTKEGGWEEEETEIARSEREGKKFNPVYLVSKSCRSLLVNRGSRHSIQRRQRSERGSGVDSEPIGRSIRGLRGRPKDLELRLWCS